jgi:hypothetical protein
MTLLLYYPRLLVLLLLLLLLLYIVDLNVVPAKFVTVVQYQRLESNRGQIVVGIERLCQWILRMIAQDHHAPREQRRGSKKSKGYPKIRTKL